MEIARRAVDKFPASARANFEYGCHLYKLGRTSPKHPEPHLVLSQVYFRMGADERARAEKETSLRLRREDPAVMEAPQGRPFPAAAR